MGNKTSLDLKSTIQEIQLKLLDNFSKKIVKEKKREIVNFDELTFFKDDPDYIIVKSIMDSHNIKIQNNSSPSYKNIDINLSRAISCFICAGIGDALGTHAEFIPIEYNRSSNIIENFNIKDIKKDIIKCNLGEFSDDTSMALCLSDSLLFNNFEFEGADLQIKFINWWYASYNNCLNPRRKSFGLGGNIKSSMISFIEAANKLENIEENPNLEKLPQYSLANDTNSNGNGSIMRLAPVPIAFASDPNLLGYALKYAYLQSKVTHTGEEAAECCRLLTHLIIKLIQRKDNSSNVSDIKISIDDALKDFTSPVYTVECLKNSKMEDEEIFKQKIINKEYNKKYSKSVADRNWNWKEKNFRYSPSRENIKPHYVGSYCMDALAMALHLSYYSSEPKDAIIRAVNMGGDCDTVGAITGMIVGSYYGLDEWVMALYDGIKPFDKYKLAYMSYKLYSCPKNL